MDLKTPSPEELTEAMLRAVSDEKLAQMAQVLASMFVNVKREATRRGIWERILGRVQLHKK